MTGAYRFDRFVLDPADRRLTRDGEPVELSGRYLDALALLVANEGRLVTKDRFMDEVWKGVPVTDEALTQCVRSLRRALEDDAGRPRFIETVPKHGYRFIGTVERTETEAAAPVRARNPWSRVLMLGWAGTLGGGVAGLAGGALYGLIGAAQAEGGVGGASVLAVLVCLTMMIGVIGGFGVAFGIAAGGFGTGAPGWRSVMGGALGGLVVGSVVKLLGLDAFNLLFGQSPGDITGGVEGAILGGAVGMGAWLAGRGAGARLPFRLSVAGAGLAGAVAGVVIPLMGGRLMAGSLDLLARQFPQSRLRVEGLGALVGESGFGPVSQIVLGGLEGLLFGAGVLGAMILARRGLEAG